MKLKKWLQTNSLFLRVISVAVAGVILATILITWISIQTLQKNYLKTFRNANQIFTEQINTDMTEFYAETATVMQTVRESWAFRRYFGMLDMSTPEASYTIYSMKRQIDAIQSNQLKRTIRIIAIGRNGRSFISGDSSLSISQEEILNSTFTKSIQKANGKPVVQYVENGGRLLLLTGYIEQGKMENLLTVTKAMGLTVGQGLIMEGDGQMHLNRYPHYLLPTLESHTITSPFTSGRYYILVPMAQPLEETEDSSAAVTWLLTTSESAYTKAAGMNATTVEKEDGDEEGQFHVAAASELGEGRLVWIASSEFLDDNVNAMVSGANGNLLMNAVDWMAGQEETISIRSKSLDEDGLTVTGAENSLWSAVMIGILPAALIALGIVICIRRKRR